MLYNSLPNMKLRQTTNYHRTFGISTLVERSLQISPFLTNKPNFQKSQMNVTYLLTRDYEKKDTWWSGKNKPNSNPIQTQYKANTKPIQSQYKPNTNPIQSRYKANTNPNKPDFKG